MVERIVDGDTLWVRIDKPGGPLTAAATHQIRVLEIDSPETKHPKRSVECWGREATAFAYQTLPVGSAVYLVADKEDRDRFGLVNRTTVRQVRYGECSGVA
ncbi:MAG: thermonuclease family protein [Actinomycetota bacterium]|nr:thermonuclease family protein [Actinomycetota bacterium]